MARIEKTVILADEATTASLGASIAKALRPRDAVLLSGPLGAGKTTLARAILAARGVAGQIPSPTFTLVQSYETPDLTLSHFDLYRIAHEMEVAELGFEDALDQGAVIVEWPERAPSWMPENALKIELRITPDDTREALLSGAGHWKALLGPDFSETDLMSTDRLDHLS